jgi:hypothetical protein
MFPLISAPRIPHHLPTSSEISQYMHVGSAGFQLQTGEEAPTEDCQTLLYDSFLNVVPEDLCGVIVG